MENIVKYTLAPIGGVYIFLKCCNFFSYFFPPKNNVKEEYHREFKPISGIQLKNITKDFGGEPKEDKNNSRYVFVININEYDKEEESILGLNKSKSDRNFYNISKIVDFILLNIKPEEEIILNIDSPGGSVIDYFDVYNHLERLKNKNYKMNVFVRKIAASGGYLISCIGKIHASKYSEIGSIGVFTSGFNFNELLKFLKINYKSYKSSDLKNIGDPFDVPKEETDKKIQEDIMKAHQRFKSVVFENRKNINIDKVSTADVWSGYEALELGLIDEINTVNDYLIDKAKDTIIYEINYKQQKTKEPKNWLDILSRLFS